MICRPPWFLVLLVFCAATLSDHAQAQSPANGSTSNQPPEQQPNSQSPTPQPPIQKKPSKVWTNDDFPGSTGANSIAGGSASRSRHLAPGHRGSSSEISIVSPSDGTIMQPGETIPIDVRVAPTAAVEALVILNTLGAGNEIRRSPPWSFTLTVPTDETGLGHSLIGIQSISVGGGVDGQHAGEALDSITVDVEEPDVPTKLWTQMTSITMESIGEQSPIKTVGFFPNGHQLEVNESSYISWESADPSVATVDDDGMATATGPGKTSITATYSHGGHSVQLSIQLTVFSPQNSVPRPRP